MRGSARLPAVLSVMVLAALAACTTDYQEGKEDPLFGAPNALADQRQPGPSSAVNDRSSTGSNKAACAQEGGVVLPEGAACAASFKTDVLAMFVAQGCGIVGCHGGATPQNPPKIVGDDPAAMYSEFAAFKMTNGKFYINPCSTDAAASGIAANVNAAAPKADQGTLMPSGTLTGLPPDLVAKIDTWLACGSPNN